mmetsp:Transcript_35154/g.74804  ORF Transcript_35154/g.74804 Transcript_35154/m.74804 type:complete len:1116 (-) Transcript_35154:92-3439(-)
MGIAAASCRPEVVSLPCLSCSTSSRRNKPQLSKYRIANEINNGPSTLVYRAVGKKDKQEYTLRLTYRHHVDILHDRKIDTRQIYKIDPTKVEHPNILKYHEWFHTEDLFATITTYCPGGSLEDFVLEPSNNYTNANITNYLSRLASIFRQIVSAVVYLHNEKNLIHGNLKLTNIFLKDHKRTVAVIGDLGRLCKPTEEKEAEAITPQIGNYIGTSIYLAPECIAGKPPSYLSDVYAIGACVYVAVDSTGPFHAEAGNDDNDSYRAQTEKSVEKAPEEKLLSLRDPSILGPIREFMDAATAPLPANRATSKELLDKQWLSPQYCYQPPADSVNADDATRLFVTSDEGRDLDFELGKVTAATLMRRHPLRIIGCVAGLYPADMRARLIKGTLIELGLESIPVATGEPKVEGTLQPGPHEFAVPYLASQGQLYQGKGVELCKETLSRSPDKTVTFILQSGPTDVWKCLEMEPDLFMRKVSRVILRSDVRTEGQKLVLSEDGRILPDVSSASHLDRNHMCELFDLLQDLGIPMTIVTRFASYAAKLPFKVYTELGNTQHPVAQRLMNQSRQSIEFLWERCLLPKEDPSRKGLPERCDKEWFCKVFLKGRGKDRGPNDTIWDLCEGFSSFSPLQMIAAVPELKERFFKPMVVPVRPKRNEGLQDKGVMHEILGVTEEDHGVARPEELSDHITKCLLTGFTGTDTVQQHLLIMSDDGKDLDDELAKLLLKSLAQRNLAICKGFIAALHPALRRAMLSKGTLQKLGLDDIPVGVGAAMGTPSANAYEFDVGYMAKEGEVVPNGVQMFARQMEQAPDGIFTLVVLCGMRDAWDLLDQHTDLFRRKISRVVIMGGVEVNSNNEPILSDEGFMTPDTAANNMFDMEAARYFYRGLQAQSIPMTIVSRWAAYAGKLPLSLYDRMARTGHKVAERLQRAQQTSLQHLWKRANMSADNPAREGLPARCNKEWFSSVFLGGKGLERTGEDSVWDLATTFQPYDCIALLGALPGIRDRYLNPNVFQIKGNHGPAVHEVMGLSAEMNGVRDGVGLRAWLEAAMLEGVESGIMNNQPSHVKFSETQNSIGSKEVHHVRAFAQKYAHQTPKMKSGRMVVLKNLLSFCAEEGLL